MNKIRLHFGWWAVLALFLSVIPCAFAQNVELPLAWQGDGKAVIMTDDGVQDFSVKVNLNVDTDGWVTGKVAAEQGEVVIKRFYYETQPDGDYKIIILFLDNDESNPSMYLLNARVLKGQLLYGEIFKKNYEKEGEIEKGLSLGDNSAQEIYSDYFPSSLKKAMEKCKPIGFLASKGAYVK